MTKRLQCYYSPSFSYHPGKLWKGYGSQTLPDLAFRFSTIRLVYYPDFSSSSKQNALENQYNYFQIKKIAV